jgi:hypothetical protein
MLRKEQQEVNKKKVFGTTGSVLEQTYVNQEKRVNMQKITYVKLFRKFGVVFCLKPVPLNIT